MNVLLIFDDESVYHPELMSRLLRAGRHDWVGVALTDGDPTARYMLARLREIGPREAIRAALRVARTRVLAPLAGRAASLRSVASAHGVPVRKATDVNAPEFISWVRDLNPDVIVSSNNQIFGRELLQAARLGCINRHASLLPTDAGLLPVFYAIARGDREVGVSVHFMDEGLDSGQVIVSESIALRDGETLMDIYTRCFRVSARLILESLTLLEQGQAIGNRVEGRAPSYNSFPTVADWQRFRHHGGRVA